MLRHSLRILFLTIPFLFFLLLPEIIFDRTSCQESDDSLRASCPEADALFGIPSS